MLESPCSATKGWTVWMVTVLWRERSLVRLAGLARWINATVWYALMSEISHQHVVHSWKKHILAIGEFAWGRAFRIQRHILTLSHTTVLRAWWHAFGMSWYVCMSSGSWSKETGQGGVFSNHLQLVTVWPWFARVTTASRPSFCCRVWRVPGSRRA